MDFDQCFNFKKTSEYTLLDNQYLWISIELYIYKNFYICYFQNTKTKVRHENISHKNLIKGITRLLYLFIILLYILSKIFSKSKYNKHSILLHSIIECFFLIPLLFIQIGLQPEFRAPTTSCS